MKKLATSIATLVFAGSVSASNESFIYHGFEENNPDLYAGYSAVESRTAVQPGIGDSSDRSRWASTTATDSYDNYVSRNPDNYSGFSRSEARTAMRPGIGDSSGRLERKSMLRSDSYDSWVQGSPDQESGF